MIARLARQARRLPRDERGSTIILVAVSMTALLSIVALAVDLGMLFTARGEAQRVADSAALAGAAAFIEERFDPEPRARELAMNFGEVNTVREQNVTLLEEDVDVDVAQRRVTVTVRRIADRGSAVGTWFARVFGVNQVDVAARATAEATPAGGATCLMPFAIPDLWDDTAPTNDTYDPGEYYERGVTGYGTAWRNGVPANNGIDPPGTTYVSDLGRPLILKQGNNSEALVPSWYFPWNVPEVDGSPDVGANDYGWNIANCNPYVATVGTEYMVETGVMTGKTRDGTQSRIDQDPDAYFDLASGTIKGSVKGDDAWKASPRIINLPLFDPTEPVEPGKKPIVFNNFAAFFIEELTDKGKGVRGRFLYATGVGVGGIGGGEPVDAAAMSMFVRLVE